MWHRTQERLTSDTPSLHFVRTGSSSPRPPLESECEDLWPIFRTPDSLSRPIATNYIACRYACVQGVGAYLGAVVCCTGSDQTTSGARDMKKLIWLPPRLFTTDGISNVTKSGVDTLGDF